MLHLLSKNRATPASKLKKFVRSPRDAANVQRLQSPSGNEMEYTPFWVAVEQYPM